MAEREEKAPFNSALDLLERISNILSQITKVQQNVMLDQNERQGYVLALTKDYYLQSIPLLSADGRKKIKPILDLKQKEVNITNNHKTTGKKRFIYTDEVEQKIAQALIDVQIDLQDVGGYFMPPRKKPGKVVGQF